MIRALILDMDGVIVDSEHQWKLAENDFFKTLAPRWNEDDHQKIVGMSPLDVYHWLTKEYALAMPKEAFLHRCNGVAETIYKERVVLAAGLDEFLTQHKKSGGGIGLASSSPRAWIQIVLERFNLAKFFDAVACADDVPAGRAKPAPDIYLKCIQRLKVDAAQTLAIEDSTPGIKAAKAAGLQCAAYRNGYNDGQNLRLADFEFTNFTQLQKHSLLLARNGSV